MTSQNIPRSRLCQGFIQNVRGQKRQLGQENVIPAEDCTTSSCCFWVLRPLVRNIKIGEESLVLALPKLRLHEPSRPTVFAAPWCCSFITFVDDAMMRHAPRHIRSSLRRPQAHTWEVFRSWLSLWRPLYCTNATTSCTPGIMKVPKIINHPHTIFVLTSTASSVSLTRNRMVCPLLPFPTLFSPQSLLLCRRQQMPLRTRLLLYINSLARHQV